MSKELEAKEKEGQLQNRGKPCQNLSKSTIQTHSCVEEEEENILPEETFKRRGLEVD